MRHTRALRRGVAGIAVAAAIWCMAESVDRREIPLVAASDVSPKDTYGEATSVNGQTPPVDHRPGNELLSADYIDLENGADLDNLTLLRPGRPRLDRLDGYADWRADRNLTPKQKSRIDKLRALTLDPKASHWWRGSAIVELGQWGHAEAIPALVVTLRDRKTIAPLREKCAIALGRIADKRVIEPLIEVVGDMAMGYVADGILRNITRPNRGGWNAPNQCDQQRDLMPKLENREEYQAWLLRRQERWRRWWKDNGENVQLNRRAAFEPSGPY